MQWVSSNSVVGLNMVSILMDESMWCRKYKQFAPLLQYHASRDV